MTDNDIIKAYELCYAKRGTSYTCAVCPYFEFGELCIVKRDKDALDLINRQKAEIERLEKDVFTYKIRWAKAEARETKAKAEAYKEVAKKIIANLHEDPYFDLITFEYVEFKIKKILNELTE